MTNLVINSQAISTHYGLFSLNDLHKVSGGEPKHKPTNFMRNAEVQELIAEIEQVSNLRLEQKSVAYETIHGGKKNGTFVCKELVYRYAMWISPKFSLMVIRAFDALNTGAIPCLPKLTSDDTLPLRNAVNMATGVLKLDYATIYKMIHQRFGIDEIKELSKDEVGQAVEYVHRLILCTNQNQTDHSEKNAFWRKVGLLEYTRLSHEMQAFETALTNLANRFHKMNKSKGLVFDSLNEQRIHSHDYKETHNQAVEFIQRQMALKAIY